MSLKYIKSIVDLKSVKIEQFIYPSSTGFSLYPCDIFFDSHGFHADEKSRLFNEKLELSFHLKRKINDDAHHIVNRDIFRIISSKFDDWSYGKAIYSNHILNNVEYDRILNSCFYFSKFEFEFQIYTDDVDKGLFDEDNLSSAYFIYKPYRQGFRFIS